MPVPERPHGKVSEGESLAKDLRTAYAMAISHNRPVFSPENIAAFNQSKGITPEAGRPERVQKFITGCIESFVSVKVSGSLRQKGVSKSAEDLHVFFVDWKPEALKRLKENAQPQDLIDAFSSLTLHEMAAYSQSQLLKYRREAERLEFGEALHEAQRQRDRWGFAAEHLKAAAELEKIGKMPLPNSRETGDDLDELVKDAFRYGRDVMSSANRNREEPEPEKPPLTPEEKLRIRLGQHKESYIDSLDKRLIKEQGLKDAARIAKDKFYKWKEERIVALENSDRPRSELEAVKNITLHDMANYSQEKCEYFSAKRESHAIGTPEYKEAARLSDVWRDKAELLFPAAELEENDK